MYGQTSPKAHISRRALIESDGRRMEEPTLSNPPRPRAMYNHLLQTGSCHCFAHHHHHNNDQKSSSPLSSIVSQIRMLHRESVSRATDRPSCSFLSHLFLAWISGSLNTLTFWWQWCRSWKWSDLTRRKGISCHQKIQCNRPPWWPYDPPRLCFPRNPDDTSTSFCQSSISWYVACRLRFPLESGTYLFFCTSEKPLNSVDLIIVILDMI